MRKIYYSIILLAIGLSQACTPETELLFDQPASERLSAALENYQQLLVSASNGWLVEYYPQSSRAYGGYNLYFQFTNDEATVMSEVDSPLISVDAATSLYSLGEDMGPTLNFDVYNEVLNYFSDPALDVGGGTGLGLEGDYEFVFMSGNASEIILRGKKTKNTIRMTPFTGESWEAYLENVREITSFFARFAFYQMTINGAEISIITQPAYPYNRILITYEENGEEVDVDMAFVVTPTGLRFYEPLTIGGVTMQEFTYNNTTGEMVSTDGSVVITSEVPPLDMLFVNSLTNTEWFLSSNAMGSGFLTAFNTMKTGLVNTIGYDLAYAWIGLSVENSLPSFSYGIYNGSALYDASNLLNVNKVEGVENRINIEVTRQYEANGEILVQYVPSIQTFVNLFGGEFNITTTDPEYNITSVTLTDPQNANKTLTLTLDVVYYP